MKCAVFKNGATNREPNLQQHEVAVNAKIRHFLCQTQKCKTTRNVTGVFQKSKLAKASL